MIIKQVEVKDFNKVMMFYDTVCDALENAKYSPGWKKGIYPDSLEVYKAIVEKTLYMGMQNDEIISCMIVNNEYNEDYKKIKWDYDDKDDEIYVIHMLAVLPHLQNKGICQDMLTYVYNMAKTHHIQSLRLDILKGHLIAKRAYEKFGFIYKGSVEMYYEDTGKTYYDVFEYRMNERNKYEL